MKIKHQIYGWTDSKELKWADGKISVLIKWVIDGNLKFRRKVKKYRIF